MKSKKRWLHAGALTIALVMVSVLVFGSIALAQEAPWKAGTFVDSGGQLIHHEYLSHKRGDNKRIEIFWTKPPGKGPFPAIVFIHGHQGVEKRWMGGKAPVRKGRLRITANRGYVAAAVSQPGYGYSNGPPDFAGPYTQDAVLQAIEFVRGKPFVKADKVGLFGYSRGAIVASMVATRDPKLAAVVLVSGVYDLEEYYPKIRRPGIARRMDDETGGIPAAFRARSAIHHAEKIRSPLLILHGGNDYLVGSPQQAETLGGKVRANGVPVQVKIITGVGHKIPDGSISKVFYPFLEKYLR